MEYLLVWMSTVRKVTSDEALIGVSLRQEEYSWTPHHLLAQGFTWNIVERISTKLLVSNIMRKILNVTTNGFPHRVDIMSRTQFNIIRRLTHFMLDEFLNRTLCLLEKRQERQTSCITAIKTIALTFELMKF